MDIGISVCARCDSCGLVAAELREVTSTKQPMMDLVGREYLLPDGWSIGEDDYTCFCSQTCIDKYEAQGDG